MRLTLDNVAQLPWPPGWAPTHVQPADRDHRGVVEYEGPPDDRTGRTSAGGRGGNLHTMRGVRTVEDVHATLRVVMPDRGAQYPWAEQAVLL